MSYKSDTPLSSVDKPHAAAIERPDDILNGVACGVWQAYNAMETTKRRHYQLLEHLDNKKKNYNLDPSSREKALLDALLRDHDQQVRQFSEASSSLKQTDPAAHLAMFTYVAIISETEPELLLRH